MRGEGLEVEIRDKTTSDEGNTHPTRPNRGETEIEPTAPNSSSSAAGAWVILALRPCESCGIV
jgi:hypothetical protein